MDEREPRMADTEDPAPPDDGDDPRTASATPTTCQARSPTRDHHRPAEAPEHQRGGDTRRRHQSGADPERRRHTMDRPGPAAPIVWSTIHAMSRSPDRVTVGVPVGAHLLSRLDAVADDLGLDRADALHAALLCWLEQEERKTAGRNRMLTIRALTKTNVRPA